MKKSSQALGFKDHFSQHASAYAAFRPKSPDALFAHLASLAPERRLAWDVGTGNGQAAIALTAHFDRVLATDASAEQISRAVAHPQVTYQVSPAERLEAAEQKVDLITVAQALHWFNFEKFYSEVKRVASPRAVIAAWTYDLASIEPEIDQVVLHYYDSTTKRFWPPERKWVDIHYRTIPFPFEEIKAPAFAMSEDRNLQEWGGYLFTWSATQRAIKELGRGVFDDFMAKLAGVWGDPRSRKRVTWPLYLRVGFAN